MPENIGAFKFIGNVNDGFCRVSWRRNRHPNIFGGFRSQFPLSNVFMEKKTEIRRNRNNNIFSCGFP